MPQVGCDAAAKAVNIEEHGVRGTARTPETKGTLAGLLQILRAFMSSSLRV